MRVLDGLGLTTYKTTSSVFASKLKMETSWRSHVSRQATLGVSMLLRAVKNTRHGNVAGKTYGTIAKMSFIQSTT